MGEENDLFPGHAGIVVAGAGSTEEADALYVYWRDRLRQRCERELAVENFGVLPPQPIPPSLDPRLRGGSGFPSGALLGDVGMASIGVLENPSSARTRFCQTTASLIRKKRTELMHGTGTA
jgi:hypothetical protein